MILDPETKDWMAGLYPNLEFHPERKYFEYVYLASDLAELPGKGYLTIRHQLNKFKKTCLPQIEAIGAHNMDEIKEFLEKWCDWKDCDSDPALASEKDAVILCRIALSRAGAVGPCHPVQRQDRSHVSI